MRCMACGAEMVLMSVVADGTMPVAGFEHRTFMCSGCHDVERRLTFTKRDEEKLPEPMPVHTSPPTVPTLLVPAGPGASPSLFKRVFARLRSR
jgi:hypothetical protein